MQVSFFFKYAQKIGEILSNETEEEKTTQPSICSFTKP